MNTSSSVYAKPVAPRIVWRPALATVLLHVLVLVLMTANWTDSTRDVVAVKPAPRVINARLVDASEFKPKPKAAPPAPAARPTPKPATPRSKPKAAPTRPKPKPKTKPVAKSTPAPPKPAPARAEPQQPRISQAELAALTRADLARAIAEEEGAAEAAATSAEMAATYAALIQQTVINYWSRPPSARNGMEILLSIQLIPTGEVVSVSVIRGSGNRAFDRSAINAVEKAGSFPGVTKPSLPGIRKDIQAFQPAVQTRGLALLMKTLAAALLNIVLVFAAVTARADLTIEITQGMDNPTAIAVVPFAWQGVGAAPEDVSQVIESDLVRSGQFAPVARADMLGMPSTREEVFYRDWRALDTEYLLIGKATPAPNAGLRLDYELFDVLRQTRVFSGMESGPAGDARMLAHRVADKVYEHLTGVRGAFATRLLYVSVTRGGAGNKDYYRLTMSDSDGARPIVLLESREPLLAPVWAPDAKQIAYVSFETGRPAIFRQELATGKREQLTNFRGLNSSPAWSPDGKTMAMVLSKDGNPDIFLMDLSTRQLTNITRNYAIETEPAWLPDGKSLLFTSDRGGRPQIYRYDLATGATNRITFEGTYNARARVAQDGRNVVLVHQKAGNFHIALLDLVTNRLQVLTSTALDESPSIAPNGSMVLYATKFQDRGILAAVSVDGGAKFRLPSRDGDVREPAWSPFLSAE